ncbi:MAG: decarboxylating NADP(+)-dependent phosphogluconate dehydrogenase, partial [Gammaproteobacteria bacterium]
AVMGRNLALNLADHGFVVAIHNRTPARIDEVLAHALGKPLIGCRTIEAFVAALAKPRVCLLMVQAGSAVDAQIAQLQPLLEAGDIVIDGGNSLWEDSNRRLASLESRGIHFIGMGVSGGEEGARFGPSLMPAGSRAAWPQVRPMLQAIAAKVDGAPCCEWIGDGGAGHYVKMVHNGIEYGDMQLIGEAYQLLREGLGLSPDALAKVFREWNTGPLESYLIEITADILSVKTPQGGLFIDQIVDSSGQKGTGKWTAINAVELGVPLTLIAEAVNSRFLSALKSEREAAARVFSAAVIAPESDHAALIEAIQAALYCSKIVSYAQGFMLLRAAAREYHWQLALGDIALVWRGGCIIRSRFLDKIKAAFVRDPKLTNLLVDEYFAGEFARSAALWRRAVAFGIARGIPLPAFSAALAFFDGYRSRRLPANLLQAQRDYFGAHTYARVDTSPERRFHFEWTGDKTEHLVDG